MGGNHQIQNVKDLEKNEIEAQGLVKQLGDLFIAQKVQQNLNENSALQDSTKELVRHVKKRLVNSGSALFSRRCPAYDGV